MNQINVASSVLAGIMFGIWPIMMNKSGLNGNMATFVLTVIVLLVVTPFALKSGVRVTGAN